MLINNRYLSNSIFKDYIILCILVRKKRKAKDSIHAAVGMHVNKIIAYESSRAIYILAVIKLNP